MLRESPTTIDQLEIALQLHRQSLRLVPLVGKRAIIKDWPHLQLGESDIRDWARRGVNWGIITGEPLVVLDTDSDTAEAWVRAKGIDSPVIVQSGGGGRHRYFRRPDGVAIRSRSAAHRIDGLDIKGWHSYIVAAGSVHPQTHRRYEYLPGRALTDVNALPVFDPSWVSESRTEPIRQPSGSGCGRLVHSHIRDVRAYVRRIQSVEHHAGDKTCFTVACLLAEAGLSFEEALTEIVAWNQTNAFPPWQVNDLERKLRYAFARVTGHDSAAVARVKKETSV